MHPKKFESKEALVAYAGENRLTCLLESFGKWQQRLSPEQYEGDIALAQQSVHLALPELVARLFSERIVSGLAQGLA
jgi:hypothetical protein